MFVRRKFRVRSAIVSTSSSSAKGLFPFRRPFLPVSLERLPEVVVDPLVVGVAGLHDESLNAGK
jgi:hypothetical protein